MPKPQYDQKFRNAWLKDPILKQWLTTVNSTAGVLAKYMKPKAKTGAFRHYDQNQLQKAVEAVRNGGKLREICRQYGVPKSTVQDRIKGKVADACIAMGPSPVLTLGIEKRIVAWIGDLAKCGFPIKKQELFATVQKIVKSENMETPFKNGRPEKYRAQVTEEYIRAWFKDLESFLMNIHATDILDDPSRMLNADESGFNLCPKSGKVLGLKGTDLNIVQPGNSKENLTALITFLADGRLCPPLIIFPYVKPPRAVVDSMPEGWVLGKTDSGWMKSEVFYEYVANSLDQWLKEENIQRPVLFLVDGHKSHMSLELSKFCNENGIILYALPPNATHLLQPGDVAVFKPLKEYWRQEVREWQYQNENRVVTKTEFCPIFQKVLHHPNMPANMKNGFKACGLFPFNPDAVNYKKCVQNVLEKLNKDTDKTEDEITVSDIDSAKKVILKLAPKFSDKGICTNTILSLIQSLLPQKTNGNEVSFFSEEELDNMDVVFEEIRAETPNVIILENILLNPDQEKQMSQNPILNKELNEIQIAEYPVLNGGKTEQEIIDEEVQEAVKIILEEERLENDKTYEEVQETKKYFNKNILDIQAIKDQDSKNSEEGRIHKEKTKNENFDQRIEKEEIHKVCEESSEALKEANKSTLRNGNDTFEKHLLYPQPLVKSLKKRQREKTPSAISSNAWRQYYENKQKEKEEKENAKKEKKHKCE
ncbi:hypothetical protein NQ315_016280 [Exocentrus adspersus]|uniref:DDE-1 domain-containing protein n=1 Tax=Exocentrus adspersus TaxID=1586481 RepID=A0AAV8VCV7_9CUCU|nr:hypothetical protein NQ315_016280 [Exocentrus adspersus]